MKLLALVGALLGIPAFADNSRFDLRMLDVQFTPPKGALDRSQVETVRVDGRLYEVRVPIYSNGGLYDGVDETAFRGEFLRSCTNVIDKRLLDAAWEHKLPEAAIAYGRALLAAADAAETSPRRGHQNLLSRLGLLRSAEPLPLPDQRDIVRAAGCWFVFWGERGHPMRAYF